MNAFICWAIADCDSSSGTWQLGQTSSASSSPCVGCCLARRGRPGERERREQHAADERGAASHHAFSARWIPASTSARSVFAMMCGGTTRPRRSMKKVSGVPVTPYLPASVPTPS